jgi:hypothetical protein
MDMTPALPALLPSHQASTRTIWFKKKGLQEGAENFFRVKSWDEMLATAAIAMR